MDVKRLAVVLLVTLAASCGAAGLTESFRSGPPDPKAFTTLGRERSCLVEPTPEGMKLLIPRGSGQSGPVGVALRRGVQGDFEITATFEGLEVGPEGGGYGAGVGLTVETGGASPQGLSIERINAPGSGETFTSTHTTTGPGGETSYASQRLPASGRSGRLRLTRWGSVVEASAAEGDGEFRRVAEVDLGRGDLTRVALACYTGHADRAVSVVVTGLEVRSAEPSGGGPRTRGGRAGAGAAPAPARPRWRRLAVVALANLVLIVALVAARWPALPSALVARAWALPTAGGAAPLALACACAAAVALFARLGAVESAEPHAEERVWVERAYFYRLAVMNRDLSHPLWGSYDGLDAPHVAEFFTGLGLRAAGQPVPEVPRWPAPWTRAAMPSGGRLVAARVPSALLGAAVAPLVVALGALATGRARAGLVAGLVYAAHPLALASETRAFNDAGVQFFSVLSILALAWLCPRGGPEDRGPLFGGRGVKFLMLGTPAVGLALGAGLAGAAAAATALLTVALVAALGPGRDRAGARRRWALCGAAYLLLTAGLIASWTVVFNPTLYDNPFGRLKLMAAQQRHARESSGPIAPPGLDHLGAAYRHLARWGGDPWRLVPPALAALGLAALAAGELRRWWQGRPASPATAVLAWIAVLAVGLAAGQPPGSERPGYPVVPAWAVAVGAGASAVTVWMQRRLARGGRPPADPPRDPDGPTAEAGG